MPTLSTVSVIRRHPAMSAPRPVLPPITDIRAVVIWNAHLSAMCGRLRVGKSFLHVCRLGRCSHVFGLLSAAHRAAGHNALRRSGPDQKHAFEMRWHKWVVLIAGSTGSALRAVRPPNLHITPGVRRDLVYAASATGSLYRSPLAIIAQAIRAILLASAIAATLVGRRSNNAVSQGHARCHGSWHSG